MPRTRKRKILLKQLTRFLQRQLARHLIAFVSGKDKDNTIIQDAIDAYLIRSLTKLFREGDILNEISITKNRYF